MRLKTLLLSNASLAILLLGIALGIRHPILQRFALLEQTLMQKRLEHIASTLIQQVEKLDTNAHQEATWTEMYEYIRKRDPAFYHKNYSFEGLSNLSLDVLGILDREDNFIHLDWVDRKSRQIKALPDRLRADLLKEKRLTEFPADNDPALENSRNVAAVKTTNDLLLLASRPILRSNGKGSYRGTLLMGIFINREFLTQLEKQSEIPLQLDSIAPVPLPPQASIQSGTRQNPVPDLSMTASDALAILKVSQNTHIKEERWIVGEIDLLNSDRQPIQTIVVRAPLLEYQQGEEMLNQLTGVLFLVGISLGIIISLLLDKSIRNQQLLKISEAALQAANQELQKLADLDGLTQIANRRCFDRYLHQEWERAIREQWPITLILCDVDYFKRFNDTYGHQAGDECLRQVAQAIRHALQRSGDLVARYGGEEFAAILPNTNDEGGLRVAIAIQEQVRNLQIEHSTSTACPYISVSLGISTVIPNPVTSPETLIEQSDKKLYRAKELGRNQVVFSTQDVP
ncbi:diguanylate cyclase [Tumidithrix elongata RA019]|uniref:Diguanylate cyclase n=1 Tax=Tumidithrix elongata BACA0141 TaxID=2716417 RepID=A0AAW9Q2Q3_9CYAN|nr:diguanylate cyclase [Tumidithrix elongata RA019]